MEELCDFNLHGGLKTPKMDTIPHRLGKAPRSLCVQRIENVSFGGVVVLIHTWGNMEETFNPLGVSLGENFESRCYHVILNFSV
jgi:hypothetical protein